MKRWVQMLSRVATAAPWPGSGEFTMAEVALELADSSPRLKVLLVVAHPDDESECAATLYRITHELNGIVDQVVVTDGAGGQHFSAPALAYYGVESKAGVNKTVSKLRRREVVRAGRILGIRRHYFLNQADRGYTGDAADGLQSWDLQFVRSELSRLMERERYDLVLTLLPSGATHGHHKTVAILALEAAGILHSDIRPTLAGVQTGGGRSGLFTELPGFRQTKTSSAQPVWSFDRRCSLAGNLGLDYTIIVHWVIAEHKSQGRFQMEYGRHTHEHFWRFEISGKRADAIWSLLVDSPAGVRRLSQAA